MSKKEIAEPGGRCILLGFGSWQWKGWLLLVACFNMVYIGLLKKT